MKKKILNLTACLAAVILTGACIEDPDVLVTNDQTTGNIIEGRFLADRGMWYDVVEQTCEGSLKDLDRALIICDVLKNTSSSKEISYDIRLKGFVPVGLPEVLTSVDENMQDPLVVDLAWISGQYLNLRIVYFTAVESKVPHEIKLAVVQNPTPTLPLVVRVCHAGGDDAAVVAGLKKDDLSNAKTVTQVTEFVSLPIYELYKDMQNYSIYYEVEYPWHKTGEDGETFASETEINTLSGNLYR